jgi:hypothetical protein
MADPIFSPDRKWMWTGSEWIPAPPSIKDKVPSNINMQDSVMQGNVNFRQNSDRPSSTINLSDSVMSGDINIAHNDVDGIVIGVKIAEHEKWAEKILTTPLYSKPSWAEITSNFISGQRNLIINPSSANAAKCCHYKIFFQGASRKCGLPIETQRVIPLEWRQYENMFHSRASFYEHCNFHFASDVFFLLAWFENIGKSKNSNGNLHSFYQQLGDEDFWEHVDMTYNRANEAHKRVYGK